MVTRFNNNTWIENMRWREINNWKGCIYNCPTCLKHDIPINAELYIIEMNNEENRIEGIGKIKNKIFLDRKYKIYTDNNYNRYTYKGTKRIDREDIIEKEKLEKIERLLFKGKTHLKRGQGISKVPYSKISEFQEFIINLLV